MPSPSVSALLTAPLWLGGALSDPADLAHPAGSTLDVAAPGLATASLGVPPPVASDPFGLGFDTVGVVTRLPGGHLASFDGQTVRLHAAGGPDLEVLAELPSPTFAAFLRPSPDGASLLLGESTNGELWQVALDGSGAQLVAALGLPFDAAVLDERTAVVNAASCVGCDTELVRVDLPSGTVTSLVQLDGPSGPLTPDGAGGLFVGDLSPQLGGPARILHFPASAFAGALPLAEAAGNVVSDGYAGISGLAYDAALGRLYLAENDPATGTSTVKLAGGDASTDEVLLDGQPYRWLSDLQLVHGEAGLFHPYQPASGGHLEVSSTDFATNDTRRVSLYGLRPTASLEGPGTSGSGLATLRLEGAPPLGLAVALLAPASSVVDEYVLSVPGSLPWVLELTLGELQVTQIALGIDAEGAGALTFANTLGAPGQLAVQLVCIDAAGAVLGLSTAAVL